MKIEFLTQDDPLYVLPFFEEFFKSLPDSFEILHVSCSRAMGSRGRKQLFQELLSLYGPVGAIRIASRLARARLFNTLPRRPGAGHYDTLAQLCRSYKVPYSAIGNPNNADFVREVSERSPDVIVSVACPYILKNQLLSLPPLGCVNIHHAPLPRYKGMMPTFWQMFHGEKQVGLTIHYMVAKIDEGNALLKDSLDIRPGETLDSLIRRSKRHGAQCMLKVLQQLEKNVQIAKPLGAVGSTYFTFPTVDEIKQFHQKGLRAI